MNYNGGELSPLTSTEVFHPELVSHMYAMPTSLFVLKYN